MLATVSQAAPSSASWMLTLHILPVCGQGSSSTPLIAVKDARIGANTSLPDEAEDDKGPRHEPI